MCTTSIEWRSRFCVQEAPLQSKIVRRLTKSPRTTSSAHLVSQVKTRSLNNLRPLRAQQVFPQQRLPQLLTSRSKKELQGLRGFFRTDPNRMEGRRTPTATTHRMSLPSHSSRELPRNKSLRSPFPTRNANQPS